MRKVAVVTGAFGGIGYATLKALEELDYAVVALSRSADLAENQQRLASLGGYHKLAIACDITRTDQLIIARDRVQQEFGSVDVLVNSAGWSRPVLHRHVQALDDDLFDQVVAVNLRGVYSTIRTFLPIMSQDSVIVNISSASGVRIGGSNVAYAAAKAGVESLTRNLSKVLAPRTRIVSVAPGSVDTGFVVGLDYTPAIMQTPMGRIATVDDVAKTVVSLVDNKILNGITVVVDGGRSV
mgnify:FL=1